MEPAGPQDLIQELYKAGSDDLARETVDGIVARAAECAPLLLETLHALPEDPVQARVLALLGEIGEPALLPRILPFFAENEDEEDAVNESAEWAFNRIAVRHPAGALQVIGDMAAEVEPEDFYKLAKHISMMPDVPGRAETLLGFGKRLPELDSEGQSMLVTTMVITAMFLNGPRGELAESLRKQHAAYLNRESLKVLREVEAELTKHPYDPETESDSTIYDLVCPGFTTAEESAPVVRAEPKRGRNEPCWCGSGKKYKKCHLEADLASR